MNFPSLDGATVLVSARAEGMQVPKAYSQPRGRPVKNTGERNRSCWYEHGTTNPKKRVNLCDLYRLKGHVRAKCEQKQMLDNNAQCAREMASSFGS